MIRLGNGLEGKKILYFFSLAVAKVIGIKQVSV